MASQQGMCMHTLIVLEGAGQLKTVEGITPNVLEVHGLVFAC